MSNENNSIVIYALVSWIDERLETMKRMLIALIISVFALPVFAVCSITEEACTGGDATASLMRTPSLQDKYIPNNLNDMQKTDAFTPKYLTPYHEMLINTKDEPTGGAASNYNSNCQFGICLPDNIPGELPLE